MDITFSEPLTSFSGDFATDGIFGTLGLTALIGGLGGTTVGSNSATGTIPPGFIFPEGVITFGGAQFDSIILTDNLDLAFALGNFTVTTVIPEPSTWAMLLAAFAGLGFVRYRSSSKSAALPA